MAGVLPLVFYYVFTLAYKVDNLFLFTHKIFYFNIPIILRILKQIGLEL